MTQSAKLETASMQAWRDAVREDTLVHYSLGMGVAVHRREGAQAALIWLEHARRSPVRRAESAVALIDALRALGRDEEAGRLAEEARAESARYELDGLAALADLCRETPGLDGREALDLIDRGLALADRCGEPADRLKMRLRRGILLWRAGETDRALADWAWIHEADLASAPVDAELVDLLDLVSGALWHGQRFDLAAAIDMRSVLVLANAGTVDPMDRQRLVLNLVKRGGAYLDAATADRIMPTLLSAINDETVRLAAVRFVAALLDSGLSKAAASVFAAVTARDPNGFPAHWLRAEVVVRAAHPEQWAGVIQNLIPMAKENPQFCLSVAQALLAVNLLDDAIIVANRAIALDFSMATAFLVRGLAQQAKGDQVEAEQSFSQAQRVTAAKSQALRIRAVMLCGIGQYREALPVIEEAVHLAKNPIFEKALLALILRAMGDDGRELKVCRDLIETCSSSMLRRIINMHPVFRLDMTSMFLGAGGKDLLSDEISPLLR